MKTETKLIFWVVAIFITIAVAIAVSPFTQVNSDEVAVVTQWGKVDRVLSAGMHWKTPIAEDVYKISTAERVVVKSSSAASNDLQSVSTEVALQYRIDPAKAAEIHVIYPNGWEDIVVTPAIADTVKEATAQFTAEELITKRGEVKQRITDGLTERLGTANLVVTNVDIADFAFSASFNQSIEAKVTAEQKAFKAENDLARVEFESQQVVVKAEAEAESIRIQAQAINSQGGADYVQLQAIQAWREGGAKVPQFVTDSSGFIFNLQ